MSEKANTTNVCPVCKAPIGSFQTRCSSCGQEISADSVKRDETVEAFFKKLDELSQKEYEAKKQKQRDDKKTKRKQSKPLVICEVIAVVSLVLLILHFTGLNEILKVLPMMFLAE